jgi:hypothetical protein
MTRSNRDCGVAVASFVGRIDAANWVRVRRPLHDQEDHDQSDGG